MDRLDAPGFPKRLTTRLRLTLAGLWAERITRAFWPLWALAISILAALAFGVQDHLSLDAFWYAVVALAVALVWAAGRGWWRFRRPHRAEALARVDARLPGQPLAALLDAQAVGANDPASQAVWAAHRARMAKRAEGAQVVAPDLRLSDRDPYALRYVALTALVMALIFGSVWRVASVSGMVPGGAAQAAASGPSWEGWITPPAYTAKPTLYLNDQTAEALTVPTGSRIELRFYGDAGSLILSETVSARTETPPASDPRHQFDFVQSGRLAIEGPGGRAWTVVVTPDLPPEVAPEGEIGREADGRFRQNFAASDDYGVVQGQVTLQMDLAAVDRRHGLSTDFEGGATPQEVLDLPLPLRGDRAEFTETLMDDLSKSLMANMPVAMTFAVTDAAGQVGQSQALHVTLPGKRFFDPLAAALIEMRRDLLWSRANAPRVVQILRAITWKPEDLIRNERAFLRLRVAMRRLEAEAASLTPEIRDEVAEELWQIALMVEEGDLASALERLRRAQDRLAEAIQNGASPEEIQELMDEMRAATDNYMRQLAEEAQRNPDSQTSQNQPGMEMSQDQLQQMLDELQRLMEEGRTAEAAELMEQLRQFMENMQVTMGEGGGQGQGQQSPGQQAMRELGEALRGQQGLSDDAFRDMQQGEGQQGQDGQNPGEGLAQRQQELREQLERLTQGGQLPGAGTEPGAAGRDQLGEAGRAMREAEEALRNGDLPGALDRQAEALEAMREGMRNLGEALAQENQREGETQMGRNDQGLDPGPGRDPLGRQTGESSRIGSDRNMLQQEDVYRRAEELLDEIRRRSGELSRPDGERDYLKRLLELF